MPTPDNTTQLNEIPSTDQATEAASHSPLHNRDLFVKNTRPCMLDEEGHEISGSHSIRGASNAAGAHRLPQDSHRTHR